MRKLANEKAFDLSLFSFSLKNHSPRALSCRFWVEGKRRSLTYRRRPSQLVSSSLRAACRTRTQRDSELKK